MIKGYTPSREGRVMDDQQEADAQMDEAVREIVGQDEAGLSDVMAVYERIEERYVTAVVASGPEVSDLVGYSTHT